MLEILIKQQLAGEFSSGTEVAVSRAVQTPVRQLAPGTKEQMARTAEKAAEEIAMRKWNSDLSGVARRAKAERGMSLVEATIILMVLAILTAVIAPSAGDFISESRNVKGKEEVESIAMAIARLQRDFGRKQLQADTVAGGSLEDIYLLVSGTGTGTAGSVTDANLTAQPGSKYDTVGAANSWATDDSAVAAANRVSMNAALVDNTAAFTSVSFTAGGGPRSGLGWRGPYLTGSLDLDPWGSRYQANVQYLGAADQTYKAIVLSPGTIGVVETVYAGSGTAGGDDIIYVFQGSSR
jgi:type II secretory pathway pseudopilin PulG